MVRNELKVFQNRHGHNESGKIRPLPNSPFHLSLATLGMDIAPNLDNSYKQN